MGKLKESIPSNSVKVIDLYNKIDSGLLDTSPEFQRKLVWKKHHKYYFIETMLFNYPFPEVYIASAEMDVENLRSQEIVVDGKQRLTAIVEYIKGINDFAEQKKVPTFDSLSIDDKRDFLNYLVTVKDLKDIGMDKIKEIFQRINNTEYSLNINERNNAQYGDSEFAVFCKQMVDSDYKPSDDKTDIILDEAIKNELNNFFQENEIFNENDKMRMFDVQYIMLIVSTFLEGDYYGRGQKVIEYLEKYNNSFENYLLSLNLLLKSIRTIKNLKLSLKSYWYNKANLFTLIIELAKVDVNNLDLQKLEMNLLNMETKVDLYFSDAENLEITEDERKYFEVARHGSHERAARIHRGNVVNKILLSSFTEDNENETVEEKRLRLLQEKGVLFTTIIPTQTGLNKSIMDATHSVREFLKENNIHDYEVQQNGPENKVKLPAKFILENEIRDLEISLYRANNRGDERIWFSGLRDIADPNDTIAIIYKDGNIFLVDINKLEIENLTGRDNPFNNFIINS